MKRLCYRCNERPAKRLPRPIKQSAAIFCSQACAADFALSYVHGESEIALYFCKEHGWDEDLDVECVECDSFDQNLDRAEGHGKYEHQEGEELSSILSPQGSDE